MTVTPLSEGGGLQGGGGFQRGGGGGYWSDMLVCTMYSPELPVDVPTYVQPSGYAFKATAPRNKHRAFNSPLRSPNYNKSTTHTNIRLPQSTPPCTHRTNAVPLALACPLGLTLVPYPFYLSCSPISLLSCCSTRFSSVKCAMSPSVLHPSSVVAK